LHNRFWLGETVYDEIKKYADTTYDDLLALKGKHNFNDDLLALKGKQDSEELEEKWRRARTEINQLRDKMLKGEI